MIVTKPGEEKYLYLDIIVLSQGFSEPLSVLGSEIWGKMLVAVKGEGGGVIDSGMDGTVLNVDGRQYIHLSNLMKAMGVGAASKLLAQYDTPTRTIIESIDLQKEYLPKEKPAALRGIMGSMIKNVFGAMLPGAYRGMRNSAKAVQAYQDQFAQDVQTSKDLVAQDIDFQSLVDELLAYFKKQVNAIIAVLFPTLIARWQLRRLFKNNGVEDLLVALEMDLAGNPTSEMGHRMFELARFPAVQETETGEEFAAKLNAKAFAPAFMRAYDDYMATFGCRCIKDIDIATPRPYENVPAFFNQLKAIDIESDILSSVARRRAEAYQTLLALATKKGKAKQFKRYAELQKNAGYREAPKYYFIIVTDLLRRRALALGAEFVAQGRLDHATQVFDLRIREIAQAQHDPTLPLRPLVEKNLAPRRAFAHVQEWPRVIDSRGKIFRAKRTATKEGELAGDPIAPGVVRGIANVLHGPYEKPLKRGDILVTRATGPGWTPLFMNTAGVVLEVGGALQHGAMIAREYGLPCVSGVGGATMAISDGQMIEVDGSNGIVRILQGK
jgi:pyruvate,water dikinase